MRSASVAGVSLAMVRSGQGEDADAPALGIIGLGRQGARFFWTALKSPGVRLAAIADIDPQRLADSRQKLAGLAGARRTGTAVLGSGEALLRASRDLGLDAVIVATPPDTHADLAIAALRHGLHVYLEKPLALTVEDCVRVHTEATRREKDGQIFQVGFQRRYSPLYQSSVDAIRDGRAGDVRLIRAQWHSLGHSLGHSPGESPRYRGRREDSSGGAILERASHQIDVCNWVFDALPIRASGLGGGRDGCIEDPSVVVLQYPGGAQAHLSLVPNAVPERRFSGIYELAFGERLGVDLGRGLAWAHDGELVRLWEGKAGSDHRLAFEAFIGRIRRGRTEEPGLAIDAERAGSLVAYRATLASILARDALRSGRALDWEELGVS